MSTSRRLLPDTVASGSANVSTLTVLKAFADLGYEYHTLLFTVTNLDGSNPLNVTFETSENGTNPDCVQVWNLVAQPGKQASMQYTEGLRRYWRISAATNSPGFPTVACTWEIRGISRRVT